VTNSTSNRSVILQSPVNISITKTPVYAVYPLNYLLDFNDKPVEEVIASSFVNCQDGFNSQTPTCGFAYDSQGKKIPNSQGYCC